MNVPPIWLIEGEDTRIYLFGGGPPPREPWSSPRIEELVPGCDVFWNEVPPVGPEGPAVALQYGIDREAPLATWLTADELACVHAAAAGAGVAAALLAPLRPWLAAQVLKIAAETRAGLRTENSAEVRLAEVAEAAGLEVRSEFATVEALFTDFSSWPRDVEVQRLLSTVAEVEAGVDTLTAMWEAWNAGDFGDINRWARSFEQEYPALYEHLVVQRNRAWIERIRAGLSLRTSSFIVVGSAHLAGRGSVLELLNEAGIGARRV